MRLQLTRLLSLATLPMPVIVPGVPGQDAAEMPLAENQHIVQPPVQVLPRRPSTRARTSP